jgi:DNA-directed RNA polymerase subunit RPC12/RpoP
MGQIIKAVCVCGYASGELLEGYGMAGPHSGRRLASCARCREVVSVDSSPDRRHCPKCRHSVVVIDLPDDDNDEASLEDVHVDCPRCGKSTLQLVFAGLWD